MGRFPQSFDEAVEATEMEPEGDFAKKLKTDPSATLRQLRDVTRFHHSAEFGRRNIVYAFLLLAIAMLLAIAITSFFLGEINIALQHVTSRYPTTCPVPRGSSTQGMALPSASGTVKIFVGSKPDGATANTHEAEEPRPAMRFTSTRVAPKYSHFQSRQSGLDPDRQKLVDETCPLGEPVVDHSFPHGPTHLIVRKGYVLEHSSEDKIPLWVEEHVTIEQLSGNLTRSDQFRPDPELPKGDRSELLDYRNSGYDRGHQAPAGDQTVDATLKSETFYLSNMAPQAPDLNRKIWAGLEDQCRRWTEQYHESYIITGGFEYDPKEETAAATGTIDVEHIGQDGVTVPTHFYKVFLVKDHKATWHAIGFVMENQGYPKPWHFDDYIKSVKWIEDHTGIDFFPNADPREKHRLEDAPTPLSEITDGQ